MSEKDAATRLRDLLFELETPLSQISRGITALVIIGAQPDDTARAVDFVTGALEVHFGKVQETWKAEWKRTMRNDPTKAQEVRS